MNLLLWALFPQALASSVKMGWGEGISLELGIKAIGLRGIWRLGRGQCQLRDGTRGMAAGWGMEHTWDSVKDVGGRSSCGSRAVWAPGQWGQRIAGRSWLALSTEEQRSRASLTVWKGQGPGSHGKDSCSPGSCSFCRAVQSPGAGPHTCIHLRLAP